MVLTKKMNYLVASGLFIGMVMLSSLLMAIIAQSNVYQAVVWKRGAVLALFLSIVAWGIAKQLEKSQKKLACQKVRKK